MAVVFSKLGWAYRLEGHMRQALSYYNQALTLDAADLLSLYELGQYHWVTGDHTRAQSYFARIKQHDWSGQYTKRLQPFC